MNATGHICELWRYPVKSMRGEPLSSVLLAAGGLQGDRRYAIKDARAPAAFPWLTGREFNALILYAARTSSSAASGDRAQPPERSNDHVMVTSPDGQTFAVDDAELIDALVMATGGSRALTLVQADRAIADTMPISLISRQTVSSLEAQWGQSLDPRRFRANLYINWDQLDGYPEDAMVGAHLQLGNEAIIEITERDPRCAMVCIDPDTGTVEPGILRTIASARDAQAGVYGRIIQPGIVNSADRVYLL